MSANIEIKARIRDFSRLEARAAALSDTPRQLIPQYDIFFNTPRGRLKLRILAPDRAQLVYYERPNQAGPKRSNYTILETGQPEVLRAVLEQALGVRGTVRKVRQLYLVGQTRIHLDRVEDLGDFLELEVVLAPGQGDAEGQAIARDLMLRLEVRQEDLLEGAYLDLLEQK